MRFSLPGKTVQTEVSCGYLGPDLLPKQCPNIALNVSLRLIFSNDGKRWQDVRTHHVTTSRRFQGQQFCFYIRLIK